MSELEKVRILRKPTWCSSLMRGDVVYMGRSLAAHYVSHGVAEYPSGATEPPPPPETQLVDPAVDVIGLPAEKKAKLNELWRKTKRR